MTDREEGVLSRWSRLKRESAPAQAGTPTADDANLVPRPAPGERDEARADDGREMLSEADLPEIDSLDFESDYSRFLQDNVPAYLRRLALSRLWRSDPVLANVDGLNDYDLNYSLNEVLDVAMQSAQDLARGTKRRNQTDLRGHDAQGEAGGVRHDGGTGAETAPKQAHGGEEGGVAAGDGKHRSPGPEREAPSPDDDRGPA